MWVTTLPLTVRAAWTAGVTKLSPAGTTVCIWDVDVADGFLTSGMSELTEAAGALVGTTTLLLTGVAPGAKVSVVEAVGEVSACVFKLAPEFLPAFFALNFSNLSLSRRRADGDFFFGFRGLCRVSTTAALVPEEFSEVRCASGFRRFLCAGDLKSNLFHEISTKIFRGVQRTDHVDWLKFWIPTELSIS